MVKIIRSDRAGKNGKIGVGCSAAVFDDRRERILLIRRSDNGKWAVPGGYMDPGENFSEACKREVFEETGLEVQVQRLVSIYTDPDLMLEYADGNRWQLVILHFEAIQLDGELTESDESTAVQFYTHAQIDHLEMSALDHQRVADAFANQASTLIRNEFGL
jgi:ADP-ribose pyrophosphatase YjhB (NUDIX family)